MSRLKPEKLHVRHASGVGVGEPLVPRCYTLTHSDTTGDLYLTVARHHDRKQVSGLYTRLMRDEVLAEWGVEHDQPSLHIHCHVSGGLVLGTAGLRDAIFRRELPLVLEAIRLGDNGLFEARPELNRAPILVHFHSPKACYNRTEQWGTPGEYEVTGGAGQHEGE
ncbi:MAG: staygreen family protein [Chloroflexota bacterium]|nr:staygreen family protein [Chloroflexota bacterium]